MSEKPRFVTWALAAAGWVALCAAPWSSAGETAKPADAAVDSFGVNTHAGVPWMIYDNDVNWQRTINAIGDIGVRYVRDDPIRPDRLNALSAQTGAKVVLIAQDGWTRIGAIDQSGYASVISRMKSLTHLAYIEGPNEPDGVGDPNWASKLLWWQSHLYADAKADPMLSSKPVIGPSAFNWPEVPGIAQSMDLLNVHNYAGTVPTNQLAPLVAYYQSQLGNKPAFVSETGYPTIVSTPPDKAVGISEKAQAKYLPRLVLDYFNAGITKTMSYELLDDQVDDPPNPAHYEYHWGLLRSDFTYKPAATALKNMFKLLADPGPEYTPSTLDYTLTGGNSLLRHTLLQKRDGTFWLALWQDSVAFDLTSELDVNVAPIPVTLNLSADVAAARLYEPNESPAALASFAGVRQLNLMVPDEVMLVQLDFAGVTVPEPTGALASLLLIVPLLGRRTRRNHLAITSA